MQAKKICCKAREKQAAAGGGGTVNNSNGSNLPNHSRTSMLKPSHLGVRRNASRSVAMRSAHQKETERRGQHST